MNRLINLQLLTILTLALALLTADASAQENTLTLHGTFGMDATSNASNIGDDLYEVFANGHDHEWMLTLYGVSYSYDHYYDEWNDWSGWYVSLEQDITRVHATSFDLQFFGPDADILNEVVSRRLVNGSLREGAVMELSNEDYVDFYNPEYNVSHSFFSIALQAQEHGTGLQFYVGGINPLFSMDEFGYPLVEPQRLNADCYIQDFRTASSSPGELASFEDSVEIGTAPPPPLLASLAIADGSAAEGDKGTRLLELTVTLSRRADEVVSVNYATANGTALAKSDYSSHSGILRFQPGETSRTISVAIKGDRKREANETFVVRLANASGAEINDGSATATILNDD